MISRIESNCQTGEVKYFDQNENEIHLDVAQAEILAGQQNAPEGNEPIPTDEPTLNEPAS